MQQVGVTVVPMNIYLEKKNILIDDIILDDQNLHIINHEFLLLIKDEPCPYF